MMRARLYVTVLSVAAATSLVVGTVISHGSDNHGPGEAAARQGVVYLLRQTASYEYKPFADQAAMLDAVDVSVVGKVDHLETAVVNDELDGQGALLVAIQPEELWKGSPATEAGLVYFAVPRPKNIEADVYRTALPAGTDVVLFGVVHPPATNFSSGDPGVTTYVPVPQGLYIDEPAAGLQNVWAEDLGSDGWPDTATIGELRDAALSD